MNTNEESIPQKFHPNSTDVNMRNVYQRIDDFIGTDSKELFKCYELHDLLQKEKEDIETKVSRI